MQRQRIKTNRLEREQQKLQSDNEKRKTRQFYILSCSRIYFLAFATILLLGKAVVTK